MAEFLVCEGPADGLDLRVLNKIVAQHLGASAQIIAAGGDQSLGGVRAHLEEKSRGVRPNGSLGHARDKAFSIEDRNFRPRPDAEKTWTNPECKKLMWRRHEIENYLLEPRVLLSAFDSLRKTQPWAGSLPQDARGVSTLLMALARPLLEGHAGQLLRFELDLCVRQTCSLSVRQPHGSTRGFGRLQWLSELTQEAVRIQAECNHVLGLSALNPLNIEARYDQLLTDVQASSFLESGDFLIDMGGHELLGALLNHLQKLGAARLSTDDLEEELVNALDREYQTGLFTPDEFEMLAKRLGRRP